MSGGASEQATTPSYVKMLVEDRESGALTALETIRDAGNAGAAHGDAQSARGSFAEANDPSEVPETCPPEKESPQGPRGGELAFRVSTPERIRRRSELLYGEIQTMLERHDARTGREREVQRRASRGSRVAASERTPSTTRQAASPAHERSVVSSHTPLPNLHQMFEESRRTHLTEAQQQRTYFPSSSKPTAYSSKDPGTFSYRFQSMDAPSSRQ